jgi:hypothetical protein
MALSWALHPFRTLELLPSPWARHELRCSTSSTLGGCNRGMTTVLLVRCIARHEVLHLSSIPWYLVAVHMIQRKTRVAVTIEDCNLVVETLVSHVVGRRKSQPLDGMFETQTEIIVGIATHTYSTTKDSHEGVLRHVSALAFSVFFSKPWL